jgi:hypothetical protein
MFTEGEQAELRHYAADKAKGLNMVVELAFEDDGGLTLNAGSTIRLSRSSVPLNSVADAKLQIDTYLREAATKGVR